MIDYSQARIMRLAITWVGNQEQSEGVSIPKMTLVQVNDMVEEVLMAAIFKPFEKVEEYHYFFDEEDVSNHPVYQSMVEIFRDAAAVPDQMRALSERLYRYAYVPRFKGGELILALVDGATFYGESVPVIALLKVNGKEHFLKTDRRGESIGLEVVEGFGTAKPAMSALIFGVDEAEGFRVLTIDNIRKKDEIPMWTSQFLGLKPIEDNFYHTRHYLQMTGDFISNKARHKFGLERADAIDLLNKTNFYFKENEQFEWEDFSGKLFDEPEQQEAFQEFKQDYTENFKAPLADTFDISKTAVRKSNAIFKSVIKLDKNFHIYVHGRRDLIERGFDEEKGKNYYKVFFEAEE
jgi:hypothetical protein